MGSKNWVLKIPRDEFLVQCRRNYMACNEPTTKGFIMERNYAAMVIALFSAALIAAVAYRVYTLFEHIHMNLAF